MDEPCRPADAYHVMAELLPGPYFVTPPPEIGVRLTVTGADGVRTIWDMTEWQASSLMRPLRKKRMHVESANFDSRRAA